MTRVPTRDGLQQYAEIDLDEVELGDRVRFMEPHEGVDAGEVGTVVYVDHGRRQLVVEAVASSFDPSSGVVTFGKQKVTVPLGVVELLFHDDDARL